jgi:hypothetical protein
VTEWMARIKTGLVERSALLRRLMNNPKADSDEHPQWVEPGHAPAFLQRQAAGGQFAPFDRKERDAVSRHSRRVVD